MKILLVKPKALLETITKVNPLIMLEPLELGYVAAAAPDDQDVQVLDLRLARFPRRTFIRTLKRYKPDLVGISGYSHELEVVKKLARITRRILPDALIVVGGHHATVLPHNLNTDEFDAIVRGEGCAPFRAIIETALAGRRDFEKIENVLATGEKYDHEAADQMPHYPDLSTLPAPRRDLWDPANYRCVWPSQNHPDWETIFPQVSLVRTSFGCCMECSFCVVPSLSRRRHMVRSPSEVAEEIATVSSNHIYFCDDETFINPKHAQQLAEAIAERGVHKHYFAWARSTTVNRHPELFAQWREIGLDAVFLGFEAITDEELQNISKHSSVEENERAHATLLELDIAVQAGFMANASFTRDDFQRLKDYIRKMPRAQITCTVFTPSPGSPAWHEELQHYVCEDPFFLHDCMHPLTPTSIPLRDFYKEFAEVSAIGAQKNPLRAPGVRFPFRDIIRIIRASTGYSRAMRRAYRDYPSHLR